MTDTEEIPVAEDKPVTGRKNAKLESRSRPEIPESPRGQAVTRGGLDDVVASVGQGATKSLSVHHIQRRLIELGYARNVYKDRDGFWNAGTSAALAEFRAARGLEDAEHRVVLESLFERDSNVRIVD